ncbi:MAG: transcriptional repressor [Rhizomicrobium sp.]
MSGPAKARFELTERRSPQAFIDECKAAGIRMGSKRRAIAKALAGIEGLFDFDSVWARIRGVEPAISRGTVYLSLRRFRGAGLIRKPHSHSNQTVE